MSQPMTTPKSDPDAPATAKGRAPHRRDEFGRLASVFNDTLGRLESSFDQMRRFTADVSHELRTPLTAIRGYVEALAEGDAGPDESRRFLEIITRHTRRMESLVKDLLRLARLDAGQEILDVAVCDTRSSGRRKPCNGQAILHERGNLLGVHDVVSDIRRQLQYMRSMQDQIVQVRMNMAIEEDPWIRRHIRQSDRFLSCKLVALMQDDHKITHTQHGCGDRRLRWRRCQPRHVDLMVFEFSEQVAGKSGLDLD